MVIDIDIFSGSSNYLTSFFRITEKVHWLIQYILIIFFGFEGTDILLQGLDIWSVDVVNDLRGKI